MNDLHKIIKHKYLDGGIRIPRPNEELFPSLIKLYLVCRTGGSLARGKIFSRLNEFYSLFHEAFKFFISLRHFSD